MSEYSYTYYFSVSLSTLKSIFGAPIVVAKFKSTQYNFEERKKNAGTKMILLFF